MKQILSLALALLPCLAWAQYPSNGNQKITLGEQTSADGLLFRGVAATDTVRKPSIDTMAYMVLDTTTNIIWHYKKETSNAWLRLNLLPSDTASMLTPYWRAGRFSGVLPVVNGGTNASTFTQGSVVFAGASGTYTQDNGNLFWDNTSKELGIGTNNPISKLDISLSSTRKFLVNFDDAIITMKGAAANGNPESIKFVGDGIRFHSGSSGSGTEIMRINSSNRVGIMTNDPTEVLHVVGNGLFTGSVTANSLSLTTPLSVANGGTGSATKNFVALSTADTITAQKVFNTTIKSRISGEAVVYADNGGTNRLYAQYQNGGGGYYTGVNGLDVSGDKPLALNSEAYAAVTVTGANDMVIGNNFTARITIKKTTGSVGIGTASPQSGYRLHVVDSVYVGGNVSAAAYTTRSDYNLKDDIFDLKYGLNDVLKLQPVEYTYKSNGSKQLGFIAQDIGTILPEVVSFEESMSVNYQAIIPILTKAIQEQQALIKALEQRIINLENK